MIFVKLSVIEVNHLEIVLWRLPGSFPGRFGASQSLPFKKIRLWAMNIGNDRKGKTATTPYIVYIVDF